MFLMRSKIPRSTGVWSGLTKQKSFSQGRQPLRLLSRLTSVTAQPSLWVNYTMRSSHRAHAFNQQAFIGLHTEPGTVLVIHPKEHEKYYSKCQQYLHDSLKSFKYICPGPKYTSSSQRLYYSLATPSSESSFLFHSLPGPTESQDREVFSGCCGSIK